MENSGQRHYDYDDRKRGVNNGGGFSSSGENGGRRGYGKRERYEGGADNQSYGARTIVRGRGGRFADDRQPRRRSISDGSYLEEKNDAAAYQQANGGGGYQRNYREDSRGHQRGPRRGRGGRFVTNDGYFPRDDQVASMNYAGANGDDQSGVDHQRRTGWPRRRYGGRRGGGDHRRRREHSDERGAGGDTSAPTQLRDRATDDEAEPEEGVEPKPKPYTTLTPEELPEGSFTVKVMNLPKSKTAIGLFHYMATFGKVVNMHILPPAEFRRKKRPSRENRRRSQKNGVEKTVEVAKEDEKSGKIETTQDEVVEKTPPPKIETVDQQKSDASVEQKSGVDDSSATAVEEFEVVESYVAYVTFDNPISANKVIGQNNRQVFGNKIKVEIFRPSRQHPVNEERQKMKKLKGFAGLDEKLLVKTFEMMDFHSRGQAQLVCQNWHHAMHRVKTAAPDAPKGINLTVRICRRDERQPEYVQMKYDKDKNSIILSASTPRFNDEACVHARKICAQLGVTSFRASYVNVTHKLLTVVESLNDDVEISFENCWLPGSGSVEFGRVVNVVRRFGDRLSVTTSARKLRSFAAGRRSGDDIDDSEGVTAGKSPAIVDDDKKSTGDSKSMASQ